MKITGLRKRFLLKEEQKAERERIRKQNSLQGQAIARGLRGVHRSEKVPESMNRIYFYRDPSDRTRLKTIQRVFSPYTKSWNTMLDTNFVVMEPSEDWIEIDKHHLSTLMRQTEIAPVRYLGK
ncbi:hypothetical protein [Prochlorococcus marinus]|uniref:hypothetical protein n=1 Tax=Prochlorococcus marinus TaxID=1219 RepID=UPI0039B043EC